MKLYDLCNVPSHLAKSTFSIPTPKALAGQFIFAREDDRDSYAIN
jgi:hypothetical protein